VQLGVGSRLTSVTGARHAGLWIEWGGSRRFEAFGADDRGAWQGFQVWRADFDAMLLEHARALGARVEQGCAVTDVDLRNGVICGVKSSRGSISARMVVDATGSARLLCRKMHIGSRRRSPPLFARYGYMTGTCPERDDAPLLRGDASGWSWSARVKPELYQWTSVRFGSTVGGDIPEEFRALTLLGAPRGADVTWQIADDAAGTNWFMVGDAAASLDPTSSHGVLKALMSGLMAGHLIAASLAEKAPRDVIEKAYSDWVRGWFSADARRLNEFYQKLNAPGFN
jgi:flavin-dependent dehydrogenase